MQNLIQKLQTNKIKIAKATLIGLFPLFLWAITEMMQKQSFTQMLSFTWNRFGVMLFTTLLISGVYWTITFLVKRVWVGAMLTGAIFFGCGCVEYYKYSISGTHLTISDFVMAKSVSEMTHFAHLTFSPLLLILFLLLAGYVVLLWSTRVKLSAKLSLRGMASMLIAGMTVVCVTVPALFVPVCTVFGIDNSTSFDTFSDDKRFQNNSLISNLAVTINEQVKGVVKEPENYSQSSIQKLLVTPKATKTEVKPNVITIMSESYADFRALSGMTVGDQIYQDFDEIKSQCFSGTTIVPTFGSGTVRTEFELLLGLPVKSLNNPAIPHNMLKEDEPQPTFAQMYKQNGYATTYIHPFRSTFYDRSLVYVDYGFDQLIFMDDLTVPRTTFRTYDDDATCYRQAQAVMDQTSESDYIHITTMQNHQPYTVGTGTQLENYLEGIEKSNGELLNFLGDLEEADEPTIVLFVGDHFPIFSADTDIYGEAGITAENCSQLYHQTYLIWNNYGVDTEKLSQKAVSTFYLPHIVYQLTGLEKDAFVETMLKQSKKTPVYTLIKGEKRVGLLDELTYDRVMGERYSD